MTTTHLAVPPAAATDLDPTDLAGEPATLGSAEDSTLLLLKRMRDPNYLMTVEDVAAYLRVPVGTVRKWREKNTGPTARPVGKYLRYRAGDVVDWFERQ